MARVRGPYWISGESFRRQDDIKDRCREIVASLGEDDRVPPVHEAFVSGLLDRHPRADVKRGVGVSHFIVRAVQDKYGKPGSRGFWLVRLDGTSEDFSYYKCASGNEPTPKQYFAQAARRAVRDSIVAYRDERFQEAESIPSDVSGEMVTRKTCHVDHDSPTFQKIVLAFMEDQPDWQGMPLSGRIGREFSDESDAVEFRQFHDARMNLRIVSAHENLSRAR